MHGLTAGLREHVWHGVATGAHVLLVQSKHGASPLATGAPSHSSDQEISLYFEPRVTWIVAETGTVRGGGGGVGGRGGSGGCDGDGGGGGEGDGSSGGDDGDGGDSGGFGGDGGDSGGLGDGGREGGKFGGCTDVHSLHPLRVTLPSVNQTSRLPSFMATPAGRVS